MPPRCLSGVGPGGGLSQLDGESMDDLMTYDDQCINAFKNNEFFGKS